MNTVKTAISIDSKTFRKVQILTKKLHISRSQFFGQAAQHMIEKDENLDLIRKINASYREDQEDLSRRKREKSYSRHKPAKQW
jgi:metal-responsive CopG/Arc/MetJ family transcriptional regulator